MYLKSFALSAILILLGFTKSWAQSETESRDQTTVAVIDGEPVALSELKMYYQQNQDEKPSAEELTEFLPFYISYQLKLREGLRDDLDLDPDIQSEFEQYSTQASLSYWLENEVKSELFQEFKKRREFEIKSYHILKRLREDATPTDTARVYNELLKAREELLSGTDPDSVNQNYSTEISGNRAGGQLPWITAGTTVKSFEDALYELEPGDISMPVRTQFGYHIILLQEKRQKIPDRKVSHIFIRSGADNKTPEQLASEAFQQIDSLGWPNTVSTYSQDGASVQKQGNIGWVGYGSQYSQEFIETVMNLPESQTYSEPIQTNYGFHIFKLDSIRTYLNEEQKNRELRETLEDLPYYKSNRENVLRRIIESRNINIERETLKNFTDFILSQGDQNVEDLNPPDELLGGTLFSFEQDDYSTSSYYEWLIENHSKADAGRYSSTWFENYLMDVTEEKLTDLTISKFPEFERQVKSFLNGLIVFRVSEENIWSAETVDSTELKQLYEDNKSKYTYDTRYHYMLFSAPDDSLLSEALTQYDRGAPPDSIKNFVERVSIFEDSTAAVSESPFSRLKMLDTESYSDPFTFRNRRAVFYLKEVLKPRQMTFDEAFSRLVSEYQPIREEKYLQSLYEKYDVEVFPDRIR